MSPWGKVATTASIVTGVIGAAAVGGLTAQRIALRKYRSYAGSEPSAFDTPPADRTYSVITEDGVVLHVEEIGPQNAPLTVIFAHGWTLRLGAWHFQRTALAGRGFGTGKSGPRARLVFYDQRSHGRSTRATVENVSMDNLATDLKAVIDTAAPTGPLVIVGHSMGGMATMTLAGREPELFADRVDGVALISTAASEVSIPGISKALLGTGSPLVRLVTGVASRYGGVLEKGRSSSRDAVWLVTRVFGFARKDVPGDLVDYLDEMISGTPVEVIAEFLPAVTSVDAAAALPALSDIPTVIICGDADRITPLARSEFIAQALPRAKLVVIPGAGHMAIMEEPGQVNEALRELLWRAADRAGLTGAKQR